MLSYESIYFDSPPQAGRALDIWVPTTNVQSTAIVFVHGGGWRGGHRERMHALMVAFFRKGFPCVSLDYRISAGVPIATQLADVREGIALAKEALASRGFTGRIVLYGSSAGGHLALLAGLAKVGACGEEYYGEVVEVAGIVASCAPVSFVPWPDIFPGSWHSMEDAAGQPYAEAPELYQKLSPVVHANVGSPPLCFLLGECEHMWPNQQTIDLTERLKALGCTASYHIYPMAEHGFFYDVTRRQQKLAFSDVMAFLERVV